MVPNFLVIGAMKGGTTALYEYLRSHPRVFMSTPKELDYFTDEATWLARRGWYEERFRAADGALAVGEASTSYTKFPDVTAVPERIARTDPAMRLIYMVRDPIERIRSQFLHERLHGVVDEPIETAVLRHRRYVNYSRYWMQLSRFLEWFPSEQILVVRSEDLRSDRLATLRGVCLFLGVDAEEFGSGIQVEHHRTAEKRVARPVFEPLHSRRMYRRVSQLLPEGLKRQVRPLTTRGVDVERVAIPDAIAARLREVLRGDVAELKRFLGRGFDAWGLA